MFLHVLSLLVSIFLSNIYLLIFSSFFHLIVRYESQNVLTKHGPRSLILEFYLHEAAPHHIISYPVHVTQQLHPRLCAQAVAVQAQLGATLPDG